MPEVESKMECIKVDRICGKCGHGIMSPTGTAEPGKYVHQCANCQHQELFPHTYPVMKFMEIKQ